MVFNSIKITRPDFFVFFFLIIRPPPNSPPFPTPPLSESRAAADRAPAGRGLGGVSSPDPPADLFDVEPRDLVPVEVSTPLPLPGILPPARPSWDQAMS